jgi:hypothetical protein
LQEGKYLLRIETEDYLPWASDVYLERGDLTRLHAALQPRPLEWYEEWWVWTIAGAVVAGAAVTAVVLTTGGSAPPPEGTITDGEVPFALDGGAR